MSRAHAHLTTAAEARAADETAMRDALGSHEVEQDLPLTGRNLLIAAAVIALAAFVSSIWPWGFA